MKLQPNQAQEFLDLYKNLLQFIYLRQFGEEVESVDDYLEARNILFEAFQL